MTRRIREIIGRKNYGFRKTPSDDLRVVPDKDVVSVPKTQSLLIKSDGNEGKIFETVGIHNFEADRPAIILGLSEARFLGDYSYTALSHVDSVFLGAFLTTGGSGADSLVNSTASDNDDGLWIPNIWGDSDLKIRAHDNVSRGWLVASDDGVEGAVVEVLTRVDPVTIATADHTLKVNMPRTGTEAMLNAVLGKSPARVNDFNSLVDNRSLLTYVPADVTNDELRTVTRDSWHGAWARSCITMPGDYIRANDKVLSNLMSHLPYFKELDMVGFWQKGFRSSFWSKFTDDELRVMGELTHLGMSLRHGMPIRNLHYNSDYVGIGDPNNFTPSTTAINIAIDGVELTLADARLLVEATFTDATASDSATLLPDETAVFYHNNTAVDQYGTYKSAADLRDINEAHVGDTATTGTANQYMHVQYVKADEANNVVEAWRYAVTSQATPPASKSNKWRSYSSVEALANGMSSKLGSSQISLADVDSLYNALRIDSWVGSMNPFFVHIEDSNLGRPVASDSLASGRSTTSIECETYFACVPGLEESLSPALVEQEDVQPQARDITLEDLWTGLSYLFESDTTNMAGRHWSSISKFVRDLSPDFKVGAIHDFRAGTARTDEAIIKAGYLLGHRRLDQIRLANTDPVTAESFFSRPPGQRNNLISLYDTKGFISETARVDVVEDISDLSKRNFQTTQDFLEGQQSVGEAQTTVYHAQMMDGTEHNVTLEATLMSFGSWQHVLPSFMKPNGIEGVFNPHTLLDGDDLHALYVEFIRNCFPNTKSRDYGEIRTGVVTFVPFNWTATWEGLRNLCQSTVPPQPSTLTDKNWEPQSRNCIHSVQTGESFSGIYDKMGDYFLDLSVTNPMRSFLDITGRVYKQIKNTTGGLPYKANITMQDLIEINLIKQVTLSTGSPALQQMLDAFMLYGMRSDNNIATLRRILLERQLWNRDAHKRDYLYTRQEFNLVPMILPKSMDPSDILSIISSTNVFLHDIGLSGATMSGSLQLPHTAFRTIYSNFSQVDGTVFDLAITRPTEWFDLLLDAPTSSKDSLPASVKATANAPTALVQYYPGLRYLNRLYQLDSTDTSVAYAWHDGDLVKDNVDVNGDSSIIIEEINTDFKSFRSIGLNIDNLNASVNSEIGAGITLESASGLSDPMQPGDITDYQQGAGNGLADGTYYTVIDDRVISVTKATNSGVASLTFSPNSGFKQIAVELPLWTSATDALNQTVPVHRIRHLTLTPPTKFDLDVIGVISAVSRQSADENVYYQTRAPKYAFICPDTFDYDHQIMSLMYHENQGQRIIGPCSYLAIYGHDGALVSSAKEVMSLVGSGQKVTGDKVTSSDDSPVSADDTNDPDMSEAAIEAEESDD